MRFYRKSWPKRLWPKEARDAATAEIAKRQRAAAAERALTPERRTLQRLLAMYPGAARADPEIAREIAAAKEAAGL